jgi:hypothetical protein
LSAAKLLLQQPLRRRFLPLLVAWLGLCGGWYSTVRNSCCAVVAVICSR